MATLIAVDTDLIDAAHTTTDEREAATPMRRTRPMRTDATAGSANGARVQRPDAGLAASGQWWKAWVLLTSLGATVLGWVAFSTGTPPVESAVVAPDTAPTPTRIAPARHVNGLERPSRLPASTGMLPPMPQRPVFQAPVTRTRRS